MSYCIYASTQRILDQFRNHLHLKYLHNFYMLSSKVQQIGGSSGLTKEQWKSIWLVMKPLDLSFATATQLLETLQQVGNDLEDLISDISIILHVDTLKLILAEEGTCPMPLYLIDAICGYLDCKLNHQVGRGEIRAAIFNMFENQVIPVELHVHDLSICSKIRLSQWNYMIFQYVQKSGYPSGITLSFNMFENQVIPVELHDLSTCSKIRLSQ